jgi:hypothetical protein
MRVLQHPVSRAQQDGAPAPLNVSSSRTRLNRRRFRAAALALALFGIPPVGEGQDQRKPLTVVDVPFIAQSVDLCGGASAAMVLRYWGVTDVQAQDFAPLVNRETRGISTRDLVAALGSRGAVARAISAEPEDARREIESGRPVIARCPQSIDATLWPKTSTGFIHPNVSRGRPFICLATAFKWAVLYWLRSDPLGKYCRRSPFVFSLLPRCQGL